MITIGKFDVKNNEIEFFDKGEYEVAYTSLLVRKTNRVIVLKRTIANQTFVCPINIDNHIITTEKNLDLNLGLETISIDEILAS